MLQFSWPDACSLAGPVPCVLTFVLPRLCLPPSSFFTFAHFICSILLNCVCSVCCVLSSLLLLIVACCIYTLCPAYRCLIALYTPDGCCHIFFHTYSRNHGKKYILRHISLLCIPRIRAGYVLSYDCFVYSECVH